VATNGLQKPSPPEKTKSAAAAPPRTHPFRRDLHRPDRQPPPPAAALPSPKLDLRRSSTDPGLPLSSAATRSPPAAANPAPPTLSILLAGGLLAVAFSAAESHGVAGSGEVGADVPAPALSLNCGAGQRWMGSGRDDRERKKRWSVAGPTHDALTVQAPRRQRLQYTDKGPHGTVQTRRKLGLQRL
jgi:hypothetical protein